MSKSQIQINPPSGGQNPNDQKIRLTATKLFIDGGDPVETAAANELLQTAGYAGLDGQTTNPSLVAKNPEIAQQFAAGKKLTSQELLLKYREIVQKIEENAPGDISIEVYADKDTSAQAMVTQAKEMGSWIKSAVIKLPITAAGLAAASILKDELKLNLTLCFSQAQAAAVYAATKDSRYPVYLSPFIGRLDDRGEVGMDLIANIIKMYQSGDQHVSVLTASVRTIDHILAALQLGTGAITMPFLKAFKPWAEAGFPLPQSDAVYSFPGQAIKYEPLDLTRDWQSFNIKHELTDTGLQKFADDWNVLLVK